MMFVKGLIKTNNLRCRMSFKSIIFEHKFDIFDSSILSRNLIVDPISYEFSSLSLFSYEFSSLNLFMIEISYIMIYQRMVQKVWLHISASHLPTQLCRQFSQKCLTFNCYLVSREMSRYPLRYINRTKLPVSAHYCQANIDLC